MIYFCKLQENVMADIEDKAFEEAVEPGMIWGFALGGLWLFLRTIYESVMLTFEHGWDPLLLYFAVPLILLSFLFMGLSGTWMEERKARQEAA